MAETVGEFYARLGLDASELNQGFVQAERTIRDNIARINRERTIIELQLQTELIPRGHFYCFHKNICRAEN